VHHRALTRAKRERRGTGEELPAASVALRYAMNWRFYWRFLLGTGSLRIGFICLLVLFLCRCLNSFLVLLLRFLLLLTLFLLIFSFLVFFVLLFRYLFWFLSHCVFGFDLLIARRTRRLIRGGTRTGGALGFLLLYGVATLGCLELALIIRSTIIALVEVDSCTIIVAAIDETLLWLVSG
jgi:hypothetical protein